MLCYALQSNGPGVVVLPADCMNAAVIVAWKGVARTLVIMRGRINDNIVISQLPDTVDSVGLHFISNYLSAAETIDQTEIVEIQYRPLCSL